VRKKKIKPQTDTTKKIKVAPLEPNEKKARIASDAIGTAFIWCHTKEGYDYWETVYERLYSISQGAEL